MTTEVVKLLSYLGYQSVTVRADSEPSCTALCESIKALRLKLGMQTRIEQVPRQEHQGNYAESAIERVRQHTGTILHEFETSVGAKVVPIILCIGGHGDIRHGCFNVTE